MDRSRTIDTHLDEAKQVMNDLRAQRIDYDAVTHQLEVEGVEKFTESFTELIAGVRGKVAQVG